MSLVIKCEGLGKKYTRTAVGVKQLFVGKKIFNESRYYREWALDNISFEVMEGEAFAIIGHNGTGKSTLLSLLLGTIKSDKGTLSSYGKIASFIELGAGFHPELTGEENIYLYGSILGMHFSEIRSKYKRIAEFSELGPALKNPLRTYSSGMAARLGFSLIAHVEAKILLIDEVLAVGDTNFRIKCTNFLKSFMEAGGALVIVSHDIDALLELCKRGICLDKGRLISYDSIGKVVAAYKKLTSSN